MRIPEITKTERFLGNSRSRIMRAPSRVREQKNNRVFALAFNVSSNNRVLNLSDKEGEGGKGFFRFFFYFVFFSFFSPSSPVYVSSARAPVTRSQPATYFSKKQWQQ